MPFFSIMAENLPSLQMKIYFNLYFSRFARGEFASLHEMSDEIGVYHGHGRKIISDLKENGIIHSSSGKYTIDKPKLLNLIKNTENFIYPVAIFTNVFDEGIILAFQDIYSDEEIKEIKRRFNFD